MRVQCNDGKFIEFNRLLNGKADCNDGGDEYLYEFRQRFDEFRKAVLESSSSVIKVISDSNTSEPWWQQFLSAMFLVLLTVILETLYFYFTDRVSVFGETFSELRDQRGNDSNDTECGKSVSDGKWLTSTPKKKTKLWRTLSRLGGNRSDNQLGGEYDYDNLVMFVLPTLIEEIEFFI